MSDARGGRLAGRRILLTRAAEDNAGWAERLRQEGAEIVLFPTIQTHPLPAEETRQALDQALIGAGWLAFASRRGVEAVAALEPNRSLGAVRLAAVGTKTAHAAESLLGSVELVAPDGTARSLGESLARRLAREEDPQPVVVAAAAGGRRDIEQLLDDAGFESRRIEVYRTRPAPPAERPRDLGEDELDAIFLASPSAVTGLLHRARVPAGVALVTLGPTTSRAVRSAGLVVAAESSSRSIDGMIQALIAQPNRSVASA